MALGCSSDQQTASNAPVPKASTQSQATRSPTAEGTTSASEPSPSPETEVPPTAEQTPNTEATASVTESATEPATTPDEYDTAKEYLDAMLDTLNSSSGPQEPPTLKAIAEAIAIANQGRERFPDDMNLLMASMTVRYNLLPLERNKSLVAKRQLELGTLVREYIQRKPSSAKEYSFLLMSEAEGHIAGQAWQAAIDSLAEARRLGAKNILRAIFDDEKDAAFAPLLKHEASEATLIGWLEEEIQATLDEPPPFAFDFSLPALTESKETISLSDLLGKVTLVDFWGTWCRPCRRVIPHLVRLQEDNPENVAVVGINYEAPGGQVAPFATTKARLDAFTELQPLPYPCVHGNDRTKLRVPEFRGFPTMLVLDREGKVRYPMIGYYPPVYMQTITRLLLAEKQ